MATNISERRSKQNHDRPGNCLHFRTYEDKLRFAAEPGIRNVVKERLFVINFLRELQWPYLERLEEWGWLNLIGMEREAYVNVTKHFYFNGHLSKVDANHNPIPDTKEQRGFHTFILRRHFHITHDNIWKALRRPRIKAKAPVFKQRMLGILDGARRVFRNTELTELPKQINGLSIFDRILHLLISENLLPRQEGHAGITSEDIWLMDQIIRNGPPNLSHMVMSRVLLAVKFNFNTKPSKRGLPYRRLISQVIDDLQISNLKDD